MPGRIRIRSLRRERRRDNEISALPAIAIFGAMQHAWPAGPAYPAWQGGLPYKACNPPCARFCSSPDSVDPEPWRNAKRPCALELIVWVPGHLKNR
jgi:hypothetical protein